MKITIHADPGAAGLEKAMKVRDGIWTALTLAEASEGAIIEIRQGREAPMSPEAERAPALCS